MYQYIKSYAYLSLYVSLCTSAKDPMNHTAINIRPNLQLFAVKSQHLVVLPSDPTASATPWKNVDKISTFPIFPIKPEDSTYPWLMAY